MESSFGIGMTFEQIVDEYSDMVTRICIVKLKNYTNAQDCYQNVFVKLYKKNPCFENREHLKRWLIKVTVRECINFSRQFWYKKVVCVDEIIARANEEEKGVMEEVLNLPDKYRDVVYLHYYEGYKISELSAMLNRKEGTIKAQLSRGRDLLRNVLGGEIL